MPEGRPAAVDGLDVNEVKDGLIVYEPTRDRVHYLNATASVVFALCDGTQDVDEIAADVRQAYGLDDPPREEVEACLAQLRHEGLLE